MSGVSILAAVVALCIVIILHEAGHYLAAVGTGMKVDRFSVFGIGPPIVRLGTWRGTEFVIGAIPFGAYVLIRGMEPYTEEDDDPDLETDDLDDDAWAKARAASRAEATSHNFRDKPLWARALVLLGGPAANYLTAMLLFIGIYAVGGMRGPASGIEVSATPEDTPAAVAGLEQGDRILAIGDTEIDPGQGTQGVVDASVAYRGQDTTITVLRNGETLTRPITPQADADEPALGVRLHVVADRVPVALGVAITEGAAKPYTLSRDQLVGLYRWATGKIEAKMEGPVGITKFIAQAVQSGLIQFLGALGFISAMLGMFNLLPLPALDGGRLMFLGYEGLARKRAPARVEEQVHGYGMLALLVLIGIITVRDIFF